MRHRRVIFFFSISFFLSADVACAPPREAPLPPPSPSSPPAEQCQQHVRRLCQKIDICRFEVSRAAQFPLDRDSCEEYARSKSVCSRDISATDLSNLRECVDWFTAISECGATADAVRHAVREDGKGLPPFCMYFKDKMKP